MNTTRVKALLKREITDVLRDKKTLIMMVVVPIFLYPLLIIVMSLIMSAMTGTSGEKVYKIAFVDAPAESVRAIEDIMVRENEETKFRFSLSKDREEAVSRLNEQEIHAFVIVTDEKLYQINYLSAKNDSSLVTGMVREAMEIYLEDLRAEQVEAKGLDKDEILQPITFEREDLSTSEETMGSIMGGVIPVLMIISIVMGAIYPAIDVTAGEKERGTLETLITLPVTSFEMIMSKFLAVAMVACVSALLNIISMGFALGFMGSMMSEEMGIADLQITSFLPAVLVTVVVMLFFALFVTAICLFVCLFAKSFKEANNYATPVMLVFMLTGYMAMLPNLELTLMTAGIPIVNTALMVKQLFQLHYDYALFGVVLVSNAAYSFLMMWLLGKVYNSEAVLFGEGFSGVKLFTRRSEMKKGQMPGLGDVVLLICCIFLVIFYLGSIAQMKLGFGGVVVNQAIILAVPIGYAWYLKSDWKRLFSIKVPKVRQMIGAVILWGGAYCIMAALVPALTAIMPESTKAVSETFQPFAEQPLAVLWLVIALMPAIGEELLFRGFIFGTLREKVKPLMVILITSAAFALFHMSLIKFFTTFILGLALVLAVQTSGSIFTGMLIHLVNNTLSVIIIKYPLLFEEAPILGSGNMHPLQNVVLAAAGLIIAALGLRLQKTS